MGEHLKSELFGFDAPIWWSGSKARLRTVALSYRTVALMRAVVLVLHVRWYTVDKAAGGEAVSGFGAALVVLGILVAARPFLRAGVRGMAEQTVQQTQYQGYVDDVGTMEAASRAADQARIEAAIPDVWAERVIAVVVIVIGTLLNGYGPPVARLLGLRGT